MKKLARDQNTVVVSGDKDSCIVIMNKTDYISKMQGMIDEGISNGTYQEADDDTLGELRRFQDFLYRNFYKYKYYNKMRPDSNRPARLFGTAKTHKFESVDEVNVDNLKFRPIIDQTGTYTYNAAKIIADYLKPLCSNEYNIKDTQSFANMLKAQDPLRDDEEYVSYDVESLFTNIPLEETIEYILHQIYVKKKLEPICSKLIFKRLLYKITMECTFIFNKKFYKQIDGCAMGGPMSVTLSDIFMIKMENDVILPEKPNILQKIC